MAGDDARRPEQRWIVATAAATGIDEPSVGASAAFLGLVGALAACPRDAWGKLQVGTWVVAVVVVQFGAPVLSEVTGVGAGIGDWTSSAAHLIGLGVGAGYGYLLRTRRASERREPSGSVREPSRRYSLPIRCDRAAGRAGDRPRRVTDGSSHRRRPRPTRSVRASDRAEPVARVRPVGC